MALKERRAAAGLTQAQLADKAGMNIRQIQKLERGDILPDNLTLKNAVGLANALGITPEQLLGAPGRLSDDERQAVELAVMDRINFLEKGKTIATRALEAREEYDEERELHIVQLERKIATLWAALKKL